MQRWQSPALTSLHLLLAAVLVLGLSGLAVAESPSIHDLTFSAEPPVVPGHPFYDFPKISGSFWIGRPYGLPDVTDFSVAGGFAAGSWNTGVSLRGFAVSDAYRSYQTALFAQRAIGKRLHVLMGGGLFTELFAGNEPILVPQASSCLGWTLNPFLRVFAGGSLDSISLHAEPFGGLVLLPKTKGQVIFRLQRIEPGIYQVSFGQHLPLSHIVSAFWGIQNQPVRLDLGVGFGVMNFGSIGLQYATHNRLAGSSRAGVCLHTPN